MSAITELRASVLKALAMVYDPEIRRPITDLGMVEGVEIDGSGRCTVHVLLTVAGCPLQATLARDVEAAVAPLEGITAVDVKLGVMTSEQRANMSSRLRGPQQQNPFQQPGNATKVIVVASGKGGVGKSSLTVNLAVALAQMGRHVGLLDADIYGHSIPAMMGVADERPTMVDDLLMPQIAHGVATMSIGTMKESRDQVVAWRGPMLDRALSQLLTDVYWGNIDYLLVDLPPGTGDMPMSVARQLPTGQVLVVTTPNPAACEVAERAGTLAGMLKQPVIGVVENMSWLEHTCPDCGTTHRVELFGAGGGAAVAQALTQRSGQPVPLLAQIPLDMAVRQGGDDGRPVVLAVPNGPATMAIKALAADLS